MTVQLLLASSNAKKLTELERILAEQGLAWQVRVPADFPGLADPAETEWTFAGNALLKARASKA